MSIARSYHRLFAAVMIVGFIQWVGCAKQEEGTIGEQKEPEAVPSLQIGGNYRFPLMNNPSSLDPAFVRDKYSETIVHQLHDTLVRFDAYLAVIPGLAETWQVEDQGKTYRFRLRENARFHHGRAVTPDDVMFSIGRLLRVDPSPASLPHFIKIQGAAAYRNQQAETVSGFEIIDDRTFRIRLAEPYAPFLTALGMYQASIVPKDAVTEMGDRFGRKPVGCGPFQFVSWDNDQSIRLKRFSGYYEGESYLDGVHYMIYPGGEKDKVLADFRDGLLEEMPVYGNTRNELAELSGLQWFHRPSLSLLFYGIRGNHPLLKQPRVRNALSMVIDRQRLVRDVYKGRFDPAWTILPPGMPGYRRSPSTGDADTASARKIIEDVMAPESLDSLPPIEIVSASQSAYAKAELNLIREFWSPLGISLTVRYITDWKKFSAYRKSDAVQIYRAAWFADMPDPDSFLHPLFASDSPVNYMQYHDPEVNRLLKTVREITDPVKRVETYRQIEGRVLEASPIIPLFYLSVDRVYQSSVKGIHVNALGAHTMSLHRVWLHEKSTGQPS